MVGLASADALKEENRIKQDHLFFELDEDVVEELEDPDKMPWVADFELEEGEDAMSRMGYGVVSYFQVIHTFLLVLLLITCVNIPNMLNN